MAKRKKLVKIVNGTEVLPFAPVGSLIIDDPELAAWTHRQLTPHPRRLLHQADPPVPSRRQRPADDLHRLHQAALSGVGRHAREGADDAAHPLRPIEAGHNCILSAPDLVARELLAVPR